MAKKRKKIQKIEHYEECSTEIDPEFYPTPMYPEIDYFRRTENKQKIFFKNERR